ncbi:MAG: PAS domain S-box protein [Chloroflexi bacterium]|nr:PAS domain S-box protein [Chloroflexota bacterium]
MSTLQNQWPAGDRRQAEIRPAVVLAVTLSVTLLSFADLMEVIPFFAPVVALPAFPFFHEIHDILAVAVAIYAAYRYRIGLGVTAALIFLLLHIPYALFASPRQPELMRIVSTSSISFLSIWLIAQLRSAREQYRTLEESSTVGVYIVQDGKICFVNPQFQKFVGYGRDELLGTLSLELVHPEDRAMVRENAVDMLKGNRSSPYEFRAIRKGGEHIWVMETVTPVLYNGRRATLGNFMDVTEHKRMEEALHQSEERFRRLSEASFEGIVISQQGKILDINQTLATMLGYDPPEIIGRDVLDFVAEESRDLVKQNVAAGYEQPYVSLRKDGSTFLSEANGKMALHNGRSIRITAVRDITERKRAEERLRESETRFRTTVMTSPIGIATSDADRRFVTANDAFCRILGYTESELQKLTFKDITHPEDVGESIANMAELDAGIISSFSLEKRYIRKDGQVIIGRAVVSAVRDQEGKIQIYIAELEDVTERREAEDKLRESMKKYSSIFDGSRDGICLIDSETGYITDCNPEFERQIGRNLEQLKTMKFWELRPPNQVEISRKLFFEIRERGEGGSTELAIEKPNGEVIPIDSLSRMITFGDRRYLQIMTRDITERKKMEEALEHRLDFERTASNVSSRFVNATDMDSAINASLADIARLSKASRAYLFLFNRDRTTLDNTHEWCADGVSPQIDNLKNVPADMFPWWMTKLRKGEIIRIEDVSKMPEEARHEQEILESQDIKSLLVLPVYVGGSLAGFLGFDNVFDTAKWSDDDVAILRMFAETIGKALERKQAEEALRQSEESIGQLSEATCEGVAIHDKGIILLANSAFTKMFGYEVSEVVGKNAMDFTAPESRALVTANILAGYEKPYEALLLRKDSSTFIAEVRGAPIRYRNRVLRATTIRDITEHKKEEAELERAAEEWRSTFDSISDCVSVHDSNFRIVKANKAFAKTVKLKPEEIIGRYCFQVIHGEDGHNDYCAHSEVLKTGKPARKEFFNSHLGIYMEAFCSPVFNDRGEITSTIHVTRDITERKKAEDMLRQLNEELQLFAYTAAHDLKAPLVTIRGFAGMLQSDLMNNRPERMLEDVRLIETGVDKMQHLLKGILDYGRISRSVQPSESVLFKEIVEESLQQVAWQIGSSRASVSVADDFPSVYVDRVAMVHAVSNLVQNSMEYNDKSRPLTIEIGHLLSDGEVVYFVRDNGIGISPDQIEKVFVPFYRGAKESQGTGLGLAIVRRIIEGHGGRVWIKSKAGEGTAVCFTLGNDKKSGKE